MHMNAMSDWRIWGSAAGVTVLALIADWAIFRDIDASQPLEAPQLEQSN